VRDGREIVREGQPYCRPCAQRGYFRSAEEIVWDNMNWSPLPQTKEMEPRAGAPDLNERPVLLS